MLTLEFFEQNVHFALSLFAALVFFAVSWLYFDAWAAETRRNIREVFKWTGFLAVSVSFIVQATTIEQVDFGSSIFGDASNLLSTILRLAGYGLIITGLLVDPLLKRPKTAGLAEEFGASNTRRMKPGVQKSLPAAALSVSNSFGVVLLLPFAALAIATLYFRRATEGIERHLRPVAIAFGLLALFEFLSLGELLRGTASPTLYTLLRAFGPLWILTYLSLLAAVTVLGKWVWHYLTERFLSQVFMVFTSMILAIFLITTVSFTFLLLRNVQNDGLNNLATATNVLGYALNSKRAETTAEAEATAANPAIVSAIVAKDHRMLESLTASFLGESKETSLIITTSSAQVLLRAEDTQRWGDSISSDTLVRRALIGENGSTIETASGVLAPSLSIRSCVPVRDSTGTIVGTISTAVAIDNAFVDGIKQATGLESAVYSGDTRAATTIIAPDGASRWVGVKETSQDVQNVVLKQGGTFKGTLSILNREYLAVYSPLKDTDNGIVGMLFIGEPEVTILTTAAYLIRLTFVVSVILLVLSVIPAYLVARQIKHQLE